MKQWNQEPVKYLNWYMPLVIHNEITDHYKQFYKLSQTNHEKFILKLRNKFNNEEWKNVYQFHDIDLVTKNSLSKLATKTKNCTT